jgi:hypothetical protein
LPAPVGIGRRRNRGTLPEGFEVSEHDGHGMLAAYADRAGTLRLQLHASLSRGEQLDGRGVPVSALDPGEELAVGRRREFRNLP